MEKIKTVTNPAGLSEAAIRLHMMSTYRDIMTQHCPSATSLLTADLLITELACQVENTAAK